MVSAASMALMIDSWVASIVAMNRGSMLSFGSIVESRHPRRLRRVCVGDRESDHQVAGVVVAAAADERQPQLCAARESLELVRQKGRIGRDDDDDRAATHRCIGFADFTASGKCVTQPFTLWRRIVVIARHQLWDFAADGDARYSEVAPTPVIALA